MHLHKTLLICFLLYHFNFIINCHKNTNDHTTHLQKPYFSVNVIDAGENKKNNQNIFTKPIVKRKFTEEDFRNMNNQYALEQSNEQIIKDLTEDVFDMSHPVYGGDRPSACKKRNSYFCPSRKNSHDDWKCIKLEDLCDSHPDCPNYEDENPTICMFHVLLKNQFQTFAKVIKSTLENIREKE
uniref:Merozoite surface protein n=1 Tax=Strongyloides venezuelensis TaxID=75913 RepID=A0A0K0FCK9_STRVS